MARRTSRRPRVVWLPNSNLFSIDSAAADNSTYQTFTHDVIAVNPGDSVVSFMPVVKDVPADPLAPTATLSDLESSGYRLRRIVGKIFLAADQLQSNGPPLGICTAGFIILRVDPTGVPINPDISSYGGNIIDTNDSPWIWRRTWLVANHLATSSDPSGWTASTQSRQGQGENNGLVGGVADGPHVDAKTARIVSKDERLFLVASTTCPFTGGQDLRLTVRWLTDLRVLGSLRTTSGNRGNASR